MQPIEDGPLRRCWIWPEQRTERLQETYDYRHSSDDCMRIIFRRPATDMNEDQNRCRDGQKPRENHEKSMPCEPLIFATQLTADPSLFEIACK